MGMLFDFFLNMFITVWGTFFGNIFSAYFLKAVP